MNQNNLSNAYESILNKKQEKNQKTGRNFLDRLQALSRIKRLFTLKAMLRAKFLSIE